MMLKFSIILFLVNNVICNTRFDKLYALDNALEHTNNFFEKIKLDYAEEKLNKNTLAKIDKEITEHVKNVTKIISVRYKRELPEDPDRGIDVLNGFEDYSELNFTGAQDINFFSMQYGSETTWYIVVLDVSQVTLYQINNGLFYTVGSYPLVSGTQIIVSSCDYGALLIIQNRNGSVLILRFSRVLDRYYLQPIQDFEQNDMTDLTVWNGMNQLHLSITSRSNISIFTWFGNYFDLIQIIDIGTEKLIPFQSKGFMYLAATGPATLIYKYYLKFNKFLVTQRLPSSRDVSSFHFGEGHFREHFLSLSTRSSTVIYKEIRNRFVPFQQIDSGKSIVPIISKKAIVLLALHDDAVIPYQYDGWRFVKLNTKVSGISLCHPIILYGKVLLLMKHRTDKWTLMNPAWIKKKSHTDLLEEIRVWNINAKSKAQRRIDKFPDFARPIRILKGHIDNLNVHNINEHNSQKLKNATNNYKGLASKLQEQKVMLTNKRHPKNLTLTSLQAKKVSIKCKTKCKVNRLNLKQNASFLSKFKIPIDENQILTFKELSVKEIKNWTCPRLSLPIEDIAVDESINGISLSYLQENALKVIGNQEITGKHTFVSLNATNASMPLNIATNITRQELKIKELKVKQLNLTEGGILLPLNGPSTTVSGSIEASKLKVKGVIRLSGKLSGNWMKRLSPVLFVPEPMFLYGDFFLENAKIESLQSGDFTSGQLGSVKSLLSNAVPLNSNIPVSLKLSSEKMKWNNITVSGSQKWITANSQNTINITGKKRMLHNVEITRFSYDNLRFPRITAKLCAASIIAPEIRTETLLTDNITVKNLTASRVFGNLGERYLTDNTTLLFKPILPSKRYYHNVTAKKILVSRMNNLNLTELESLANAWIEPNILNASIEANNLKINTLQSPVRFDIDPNEVKGNIILEQNAQVDSINDISITDFLNNAIKLEDMISLQNITFNNGFSANHTYATYLPLPLMEIKKDPNLHKKRISGNVEVNSLNLPYSFEMVQSDAPVHIFIKGSANFAVEPIINNVNNIKLEELLTDVWLAKNTTIFYGKNLHIKDAVIKGNVTLHNSMGTLNPETWKNISKRVLSKTKQQEIKVRASLNNVEVPVIVGSNTSAIISTVSDFNDIFDNTVMKNKDQEIKAKWTFDTLKVLGKLDVKGKINDMDLKRDVMRHDSVENIVTGKKTVMVLTAENINGYNFDKWADNALTRRRKNVIIKGHKIFNAVTFNDLKVSGTVMGYAMEDILSKSANQTIFGQKNIQGNIDAPELVISGLVNDVNLTDLMDRQLKKNKSPITIVSGIELQNSLNIIGNLTINGTYGEAEMKNFYTDYSSVTPIAERMENSSNLAEAINTALRNRAVYINKLEVVKNADDIYERAKPVQTEQCKATSFSPQCTNEHVPNLALGTNASDFILLKTVVLDGDEFTVLIKPDSVSIYMYDSIEHNLVRLKELYIPKIMDAFVEPMLHSMWIVLRLISQTLALNYLPWNDIQEHVLPATEVFTMGRSPEAQILLMLSDGVWILDGFAIPRNIIRIPLKGKVETLLDGYDYYVKCTLENSTRLMKARYVGN